jgi:ATP-binding protein involved in chromosome partitioning
MSNPKEQEILDALSKVIDPELHKDLVALNMVRDLKIQDSRVEFTVALTIPAFDSLTAEIRESAQKAVRAIPGISQINIHFTSQITTGTSQVKDNLIPQVKNTIAISSGKGGVGKSSVTTNLAVALAQAGAAVGILDADIYGPNIPMMMGVQKPAVNQGQKLVPAESHGIQIMSMGFLVPDDQPVVWRGPMIHGAIQQFLRDVAWGELDYLLVDLPPGTGDAQLSIVQLVPLTGAVIVTTPQAVALLDSKKGLAMFQKVHVPLFGIVENMSYFLCPHCNEKTEIFSRGGGQEAAKKLEVPFLGEIPIDPAIREGGDHGLPILVANPASPQAKIFRRIARNLAGQISRANATKQFFTIIQ